MADRDTYRRMARHWSEVANAPLKRQSHYDAATERESRLIAAREAAQMHLQGAMTPDINETLPEDLAEAMSAPRGLFMQRSSKSPNYPGYEGLAGFMAKDPSNALKGYATGSVTGIGDLLSMAINAQAMGHGAPGRASLGDDLRRLLGQDPESPQGQAAEVVSPGGWMKILAAPLLGLKAASKIGAVATRAHNAGPVPEGYLRFRHFGKHDVDTLKVEKFGTGIKGAERARGSKPVISLYPDEGFIKEQGLGNHEYVIDIPMDQMYNANTDPLGLKALAQEPSGSFRVIDGKMVPTGTRLDMNKYEDLIKEKGFFGYYTPDADGNLKGQARVFHDIEIR